jgi:pimeloyl-ACP methyl ester carboxylesterase
MVAPSQQETKMRLRISILFLLLLFLFACGSVYQPPDLGNLYSELAQREDPYRNPIIVIPGILGSKLVDLESGAVVWGAFGLGHVNPNTKSGASLVALPMGEGKKFDELRDDVAPDGALDRVIFNFFGFPVQLNAYYNILRTLGVGGYRDKGLVEAGAVDYGDRHFTCFQFDYDWRRDIVEIAGKLDRFIEEKTRYVQEETEKRFGIKLDEVKFDIVTHSMGGLVARYYLRYGDVDLPDDGSLPELTWAGARRVDHLVMIAPPNGGALDALLNLINGFSPETLLPHYPAGVVGTMPAAYQLLPRSRHRPLLDNQGRPVPDIYDPGLWQSNGWGLADPKQDKVLNMLLPDIESPEKRLDIALDHQRKALLRAKQFNSALDIPAKPPNSLRLLLIAGDAEDTKKTGQFDSSGRIKIIETGPGDGTVLRSSALMDERLPDGLKTRLLSPIQWTQVLFVFSDHLGLTKEPAFADNVLYFLLESPRPG